MHEKGISSIDPGKLATEYWKQKQIKKNYTSLDEVLEKINQVLNKNPHASKAEIRNTVFANNGRNPKSTPRREGRLATGRS